MSAAIDAIVASLVLIIRLLLVDAELCADAEKDERQSRRCLNSRLHKCLCLPEWQHPAQVKSTRALADSTLLPRRKRPEGKRSQPPDRADAEVFLGIVNTRRAGRLVQSPTSQDRRSRILSNLSHSTYSLTCRCSEGCPPETGSGLRLVTRSAR